ncbi:MAG: hypothetical protein IKD44_00145 [Lentisphaeria bacterium]|nr:hypothetical protein [Lentisphaeria bacterium]
MMLFVSRFLLLLTGVLFLAGCMSFDYVGQSFVPLSDSVPVNIFQNREEIPADQYRIIGRGILAGPGSTDMYDRMAELRSEARKHGADAVCIVSTTGKAVGLYPASSGAFAPPLAASDNVDNLSTQNNAWEADSFGQVQTLNKKERVRYNFETKVIFLKKKADFDKEMKPRSSFL